eukprot:5402958-Prymnesium_polylepis.1
MLEEAILKYIDGAEYVSARRASGDARQRGTRHMARHTAPRRRARRGERRRGARSRAYAPVARRARS